MSDHTRLFEIHHADGSGRVNYSLQVPSKLSKKEALRFAMKVAREENADLSNSDFSGMDMAVLRMEGMNVSGSDFTDANLSSGMWSRTIMDGCDLTRADCRSCFNGASMRKVNAAHANFKDSTLKGADMEEINASNANFYGANMEGANLKGGVFRNACAVSANLNKVNASNSDWVDACCVGASMIGFVGTDANFSHADLRNINAMIGLKRAVLTMGRLCWAQFSPNDMECADMDSVDLTGIKWVSTNPDTLRNTRFSNTPLVEISLDLLHVDFSKALGLPPGIDRSSVDEKIRRHFAARN